MSVGRANVDAEKRRINSGKISEMENRKHEQDKGQSERESGKDEEMDQSQSENCTAGTVLPFKAQKKGKVDRIISLVLEEVFADADNIMPLSSASEIFYSFINSDSEYFSKIKIFEQSYYYHLNMKRKYESGGPLEMPEPDERTMIFLYKNLIESVLLDPNVSSFATGSPGLLGDLDPALYTMLVLLSSVSCERQYQDNILGISIAGKSSVGKSRMLHPLTLYAKSFAFDSLGVGRFQRNPYEYSFFFHDFTYKKLLSQNDLSTIKTLIRGERCNVKIRDVTTPLVPAYCLMTTNEWLHTHLDKTTGLMLTTPSHSVPPKLSSDHLESMKNRILEVYVRKQSPKVNQAVFMADIKPRQAKIALSILILQHFKLLRHPISTPAPTLIPSALKGVRSVMEKIPLYLDLQSVRIEDLIEKYEDIYIKEAGGMMTVFKSQDWPDRCTY